MNRTDTTYKKIKYIGKKLNTNNKNSKIPEYKVKSLLEQKQKKQNMITQIETTINNLEELKLNEKTRDKIYHINEKIIYYKELIIFYKKEIKNICNVLKSKCNHILVNDSIDISPDESLTIIYCELCETTF
jgi:alanyl-tRNA synthetase